ncbi:hypothetical protein PZE06_18480 [Robertmurraya sp. DFI.2.37]|jgi:hypothetical protein|uniref:hypothetical protein n=1 Tax=Robertmurraya TaxID=2837507 RepID=UPI0010F62D81|nr:MULTISPECIES: hypothetical protein [Robertmurraya]MDF1510125.1 hypothetical protein [Robertmurraya sp. DFI.2.37]
MNKDLTRLGYFLFFTGIILFGIMHLAIALYIPNLSGWSDPPGKLAIVLGEIIGWVPYTLSIILLITGSLIIVCEQYQNSQRKRNSSKSKG